MKTKGKALLLVLCAILLVVASVLGTLAYLADDAAVTNTFTVGKVNIELDEAKVTEYGVQDGDTRVQANTYRLIPGHTYTKDPKVTVKANSEKCYVFVKVDNAIANYLISTDDGENKTITNQITTTNSWTPLEDTTDVYYKVVDKAATDQSLPVFANFTVSTNANNVPGWDSITEETKIVVTAYAVQYDGMTDVNAAWTAAQFEATTNP